MLERTNTAEMLQHWLDANSERLGNSFTIEKLGDWNLCTDQGIALHLHGEKVSAALTVWPSHLADTELSFADAEAIRPDTAEQIFYWGFRPFNVEFIDSWFAAVEASQ